MSAGWSNKIQIDTTRFVCTTPTLASAAAQASGGIVDVSGPEVEDINHATATRRVVRRKGEETYPFVSFLFPLADTSLFLRTSGHIRRQQLRRKLVEVGALAQGDLSTLNTEGHGSVRRIP